MPHAINAWGVWTTKSRYLNGSWVARPKSECLFNPAVKSSLHLERSKARRTRPGTLGASPDSNRPGDADALATAPSQDCPDPRAGAFGVWCGEPPRAVCYPTVRAEQLHTDKLLEDSGWQFRMVSAAMLPETPEDH